MSETHLAKKIKWVILLSPSSGYALLHWDQYLVSQDGTSDVMKGGGRITGRNWQKICEYWKRNFINQIPCITSFECITLLNSNQSISSFWTRKNRRIRFGITVSRPELSSVWRQLAFQLNHKRHTSLQKHKKLTLKVYFCVVCAYKRKFYSKTRITINWWQQALRQDRTSQVSDTFCRSKLVNL
jgi:hypothetical protein